MSRYQVKRSKVTTFDSVTNKVVETTTIERKSIQYTSKVQPLTKCLEKTKMCVNGKKCKRRVCHFAHNFDELNIPECKFGKICGKKNRKRAACVFLHPDETRSDYFKRTGLYVEHINKAKNIIKKSSDIDELEDLLKKIRFNIEDEKDLIDREEKMIREIANIVENSDKSVFDRELEKHNKEFTEFISIKKTSTNSKSNITYRKRKNKQYEEFIITISSSSSSCNSDDETSM